MSIVPAHFAAPHFSAAARRLDLDSFELLHHYNGVQLEPSRLKFEYPHDVIVLRKGTSTHLARFNCVSAPTLTSADIAGIHADPNAVSIITNAEQVYRYLGARAAESDEPVSLLYLDAPVGTSRHVPLLPAAALAIARAAVRTAPSTIVIAKPHITSAAGPGTQAREKYRDSWAKAGFTARATSDEDLAVWTEPRQ